MARLGKPRTFQTYTRCSNHWAIRAFTCHIPFSSFPLFFYFWLPLDFVMPWHLFCVPYFITNNLCHSILHPPSPLFPSSILCLSLTTPKLRTTLFLSEGATHKLKPSPYPYAAIFRLPYTALCAPHSTPSTSLPHLLDSSLALTLSLSCSIPYSISAFIPSLPHHSDTDDEIALSLASEIAKLHNSSQLRSYMNYYNH